MRAAAAPRTFYAIANTSIPKFELKLDDVLAGLRTLTEEAIRARSEAFQIKDVLGRPGMKQIVFAPVNAKQEDILKSAKDAYRYISSDLRSDAKQHAGDVFEPGTAEYSLFLALLSLSDAGNILP